MTSVSAGVDQELGAAWQIAAPDQPDAADRLAARVVVAGSGIEEAVERARAGFAQLDPLRPPARDAELLLLALAATAPETIPLDVGRTLFDLIRRGDLSRDWQPGLDQAFDLLPLLIATPAATVLPDVVEFVLTSPAVDDRWATRAFDLLREFVVLRPELLTIDSTLSLAEQGPPFMRASLANEVITPLMLAEPGVLDTGRLSRVVDLFDDPVAARYLLAALASHPEAPAEVRAAAAARIADSFPLRRVWQRFFGGRGLHVLCVQNIADAQGDEIVRTVPLLQALLDQHPETRVTLLTDRAYLYGHPRLDAVSFDDRARIEAALGSGPDVLIEFYESRVRHLNYDTELRAAIEGLREATRPALDIRAGKGWDGFCFETVRLGGLDWAGPLELHRPSVAGVYAPADRLIMELGLPLRLGRQSPRPEPILASRPAAAAEQDWQELVAENRDGRPVALVNPFGGAGPLKGFVPATHPDLVARLDDLLREGYYLVLCPTASPWGSTEVSQQVRAMLPEPLQARVAIVPDPTRHGDLPLDDDPARRAPYASVMLRRLISHLARADLVVTVEGWMAHAAYVLGRPYRLLLMPESAGPDWQPWARNRDQRVWLFAGEPSRGRPPLPEQPRKWAWLRLLARVQGAASLELLELGSMSEDPEIRAVAARALGRQSPADAVPRLAALLDDRSHRVRGAAADALLGAHPDAAGRDVPQASVIQVHRFIAGHPPNWNAVTGRGPDAEPPLRAALKGDDPVVRREAAVALERISRGERESAGSVPPSIPDTPAEVSPLGADTPLGSASTSSSGAASTISRLQAEFRRAARSWRSRPRRATDEPPSILILTPLKDCASCIDGYLRLAQRLTYPHHRIWFGFLESDSRDRTYETMRAGLSQLERDFAGAALWKHDFGYQIRPGIHRGRPEIQPERRAVLARSRNRLLSLALRDQEWVLWLDADLIEYPADIIERLLEIGRNIVQPHCVLDYGGPTFDQNAWRDHGRLHLDDLRGEGDIVPLDAVGGTMLLIRADLHRDGLIFPVVPYRPGHPKTRRGMGELETEGLGILAGDMGETCWGLPNLEIIHRRA